MKKDLCILMVEDTAQDVVLIHHALRKGGLHFRARRAESRDAFLHELEHHRPDIILSDHGVPGFDGFTALTEARARCPEVPFIFVTGAPGADAAPETLKSGADDYVLKSRLQLLAPAIERALRDAETRQRHRRLETALLDAEQHLQLLIEEVRVYATFMLDAEGRVATWSPAATRLFGHEPNEILGSDCVRLFSEALVGGDVGTWLELAARTGRVEQTGSCIRKGNQIFPANVVARAVRGTFQKMRGYICIVHDLGAREVEKVREHLPDGSNEHRAELESAHREMERFTHTMALDLRAPLRRVESFAELLNKNPAEQLDQASRGYLRAILSSAHEMSRLIDDLFTYSRIGQTEMHQLHISLAELAKEVVHDLRHQTEGRDIEWAIGDLPEVSGDPVLLWMVMTNLVGNALKFTRPRQRARIEIGSTTGVNGCTIYVRDNGVGFDMRQSTRLFGVFQRLHNQEFEGTGVGLANVRRIIQRHGGRTWAEGAENEGATFYFSLPTAL